jgi:hypothetical protein
MGEEWVCSFSQHSRRPEAPLGQRPSREAAQHVAEQHAHAHRCQPLGPWIQAESTWFLETTCGTYIVARAPAEL